MVKMQWLGRYVTGEIKICEIPSLILTYITVHYSAVFLVTLQIICLQQLRTEWRGGVEIFCDYKKFHVPLKRVKNIHGPPSNM